MTARECGVRETPGTYAVVVYQHRPISHPDIPPFVLRRRDGIGTEAEARAIGASMMDGTGLIEGVRRQVFSFPAGEV